MAEKESSKVQLIKQAINQLIEEEDDHHSSSSSQILLSKLMSQLEAESEGGMSSRLQEQQEQDEDDQEQEEDKEEKILKEVKKLGRQNLITHCLLSAMIVLTVAWQISEVSMILKFKNGFTRPFQSIGNMFQTLIKPPLKPNVNSNEDDSKAASAAGTSITSDLIESNPVHDLNIPMPNMDFAFNPQE